MTLGDFPVDAFDQTHYEFCHDLNLRPHPKMMPEKSVALTALLAAMLTLSGCGNKTEITCQGISRDACVNVVLPAIEAALGQDAGKYDLGSLLFSDFGCDKVAPLNPKNGSGGETLHVFYDSCKNRARIGHVADL